MPLLTNDLKPLTGHDPARNQRLHPHRSRVDPAPMSLRSVHHLREAGNKTFYETRNTSHQTTIRAVRLWSVATAARNLNVSSAHRFHEYGRTSSWAAHAFPARSS